MAFTIMKARARQIGGILVALGAIDDDITQHRPYVDACVAVNALYSLNSIPLKIAATSEA